MKFHPQTTDPRSAGRVTQMSVVAKQFWASMTPKQRAVFVKRRAEARKTHGLSKHTLYNTWRAMIRRCYNPKHVAFQNWGGRGIKVCAAWREGPEAFVTWGLKNGWKPGLELDRKNNNGNYTPSNCRFVTDKQQANNRRPRQLTAAGKEAIRLAVIASNKRRALA